jgi:hypothetical protein
MSFARFSDGDVYVFSHCNGGVQCCGCWLDDGGLPMFYSPEELIAHLWEHREAGHRVHDYLLEPETYEDSDFNTCHWTPPRENDAREYRVTYRRGGAEAQREGFPYPEIHWGSAYHDIQPDEVVQWHKLLDSGEWALAYS